VILLKIFRSNIIDARHLILPSQVASVGSSILRSIALQNLQAVIVTGSYYVLGLPLGYYLAYRQNWGLVGLWTGTSVGLFWVGAFGVIFYCIRVDWKQEMRRAVWRSRGSGFLVVDEEDEEDEEDDDLEESREDETNRRDYGAVRI
jgi:MATE family multidrug resistance protein